MKVQIDIIILSFAKDEGLKKLTEQTIISLLSSEIDNKEIEFKIVVIESNKSMAPFQFKDSVTIYPAGKFGFHKYLNIGIKATNSEYVCLCNNDLIFHQGWATSIINAMKSDEELLSASPYCPRFHKYHKVSTSETVSYGYTNGIHVAGWCIFTKRTLFEQIGLLDENFIFWCADDDYRMTLREKGIKHALITNSTVEHLESVSLNRMTTSKRSFLTKKYTTAQQHYFDYKWRHRNIALLYLKYLKLYLLDG